MDEAQKVIKEYEQSKPTASVSALKNPKICFIDLSKLYYEE